MVSPVTKHEHDISAAAKTAEGGRKRAHRSAIELTWPPASLDQG
jgi:hypothetical protein